jgi:hypothetical protein
MPNLGKGSYAFTHILYLQLAVEDILDCDGLCGSGVDDAFIILNRYKHTLLVKHRSMFLDKLIDLFLDSWFQMRQIHILMHQGLMLLGDERRIVQRINLCIKIRLGML